MHCPHCGNKLPDGASFCNKCGSPIEAKNKNTPTAQEHIPQEETIVPVPPTQRKTVPEPPTKQETVKSEATPKPTKEEPIKKDESSGGWQNSMAFKIAALVVGVALIGLGVFRILSALHVFDGNASSSSQSTIEQTSSSSGSDTNPKEDTVDMSKCTDKSGFVTLYGLTELDGKQLHKVISEQDYDQITQGGETMLTNDNTKYVLLIYAGKDAHNVGFDEIDKLGVGGKGQPVYYQIACGTYKDIEEYVNKGAQVEFTKFEYSKDKSIAFGLCKNLQGDEFLAHLQYNSKKAVIVTLYNEECTKAGGPIADLGSSLKEVYETIEQELKSSSSSSSSSTKLDGGANEIELK